MKFTIVYTIERAYTHIEMIDAVDLADAIAKASRLIGAISAQLPLPDELRAKRVSITAVKPSGMPVVGLIPTAL